MRARGVGAVQTHDLRTSRFRIGADLMPRLGLDAIQRLDHSLDVGDRGLRLLGRHLQLELRVLVGIGLELGQRLLGL